MRHVTVQLLASLMLIGAAGPVKAGRAADSLDAIRDVRQTMEARKLLADEPELDGCNIGVTVHNRVATLWGPVPSAEIAFRAELVLRTMFELTAVRNELFVSELVEPVRRPLRINNPPKYLPELAPPKLPEARSLLGAPGLLTGGEQKRTVAKPAAGEKPASAFVLGLPQVETAALAATVATVAADQQLAAAVESLLAKSAYRQVEFNVKEGRVYLRTKGPDTGMLQEAAAAVSRLPNVRGVILAFR